jgi:hypothetical protein
MASTYGHIRSSLMHRVYYITCHIMRSKEAKGWVRLAEGSVKSL